MVDVMVYVFVVLLAALWVLFGGVSLGFVIDFFGISDWNSPARTPVCVVLLLVCLACGIAGALLIGLFYVGAKLFIFGMDMGTDWVNYG